MYFACTSKSCDAHTLSTHFDELPCCCFVRKSLNSDLRRCFMAFAPVQQLHQHSYCHRLQLAVWSVALGAA